MEAAGASGSERGADFGGMMAVFVDHGDAALRTAHLKAAVDTTEFGQRLANDLYRNVEFECDRHRCSRVQRIVRAGDLQAEATQIAIAQMQMEFAGQVSGGRAG